MEFAAANFRVRIMSNDQSLSAHLFNAACLLLIGTLTVKNHDKTSPMHVKLALKLFRQGHLATAMATDWREVKRCLDRNSCLEFSKWCQVRSNGASCTHEIEVDHFVVRLHKAKLRATRAPIGQLMPDRWVHCKMIWMRIRVHTFYWETVHRLSVFDE